jgi:chromate reductase
MPGGAGPVNCAGPTAALPPGGVTVRKMGLSAFERAPIQNKVRVPMADFRILGISGSLRKASFNTAALRAAQEVAPAGVTIEIAEIGDLPLYNEDLRVNGSFPAPVQRLREQIAAADALLFAVPEYNYSVTAAMKNAIDWASRAPNQPFDGKAYAMLGAANGLLGTVRGQMALRQIMVGINAFGVNNPQVLISGASQKFDAEGKFTDQPGRDLIRQLIEALVKLGTKLKA